MANYDPLREMERFANALFDGNRRGPRQMPMDLYRDGDHYVLSADLPGIDPGSVDVDVDGQLLTIRAERTLTSQEGVKWITREREAGSFLRQLSLGQGIDTEGIAASSRARLTSRPTRPRRSRSTSPTVRSRRPAPAPDLLSRSPRPENGPGASACSLGREDE